MGLMTCPDCGREVSEFATACPSCGRPASRGFTQAEQKPEGATAAPKKTRNDRPTGSGWKAGLASAGVILLYLMVTRLPVYFQDPAAQDRDGSYFLMALDDFGDRLMADPEFRQFYEQLPDDTLSPDAWLSSSPAGPTFYLAQ